MKKVNKKFKLLVLCSLLFTTSCAINNSIEGTSGEVYIRDDWMTMSTIERARHADSWCNKYNKSAQYTGIRGGLYHYKCE